MKNNVVIDKSTDTKPQWNGFTGGAWQTSVNVRDFIQLNYTPYLGDHSFLASATNEVSELWQQVTVLLKKENDAGGPLDFDAETPAVRSDYNKTLNP